MKPLTLPHWQSHPCLVHSPVVSLVIYFDVVFISPCSWNSSVLTWLNYRHPIWCVLFLRDIIVSRSHVIVFITYRIPVASFINHPHNNVIVVEQWTCWTFFPVHPVIPFISLDGPVDHLFTIKRHGGNHCQRHPRPTQWVDELATTVSIDVRWHSWLVCRHREQCAYAQ